MTRPRANPSVTLLKLLSGLTWKGGVKTRAIHDYPFETWASKGNGMGLTPAATRPEAMGQPCQKTGQV